MKIKDLPIFRDAKAKKVLEEACAARQLSIGLIRNLAEVQRQYLGKGNQIGITSEFDSCIGEFIENSKGG